MRFLSAFALLLGACQSLEAIEGEQRPPNVLLVLVDDLGKEWVSCYGADDIETPHLDRIAAEGARFDAFYAMPQCTPTRATLLTGQYPFRHGWVNHWDVPRWGHGCHFDPDENPSIGRVLQQAGYRTAIAGKWQINDFRVQPRVLAELGFEDWCMWTGYETGVPASAERYQDPYVVTPEGPGTVEGGFGPDVFTDRLVAFLEEHADEPMFLYYPMVLTHTPFVPTPHEPEAEGKLDRHRAMVRYTDHCVGRLLDALDRLGIADDTVVIFTTDNGTARGVTGSIGGHPVPGGKSQTREAGACVPFLVRWPARLAPGQISDALVDLTDLLPTCADLAGATPEPGWVVDGRSFAPLLRGEREGTDREWILAMGGSPAAMDDAGRVVPVHDWRDRTIRDQRWKLVVGTDRRPARLFDLTADPFEEHDLVDSDDPEARAAAERLLAVALGLPARDAAPRYRKLPEQAWDLKTPRRR